jgi:hypothetical protein
VCVCGSVCVCFVLCAWPCDVPNARSRVYFGVEPSRSVKLTPRKIGRDCLFFFYQCQPGLAGHRILPAPELRAQNTLASISWSHTAILPGNFALLCFASRLSFLWAGQRQQGAATQPNRKRKPLAVIDHVMALQMLRTLIALVDWNQEHFTKRGMRHGNCFLFVWFD